MTMLQLRNFLDRGVVWTGTIPKLPAKEYGCGLAAEVMTTRATKTMLEVIADRLESDRWKAGLVLTPSLLMNSRYSDSHARLVIRVLVNAGLITRKDEPWVHAKRVQSTSRTLIHPSLVELSESWARSCRALKKQGKKGAGAYPPRTEIQLPLIFPAPAGKPSPARVSEGRCTEASRGGGIRKSEAITVFTPPSLPDGAGTPVPAPSWPGQEDDKNMGASVGVQTHGLEARGAVMISKEQMEKALALKKMGDFKKNSSGAA